MYGGVLAFTIVLALFAHSWWHVILAPGLEYADARNFAALRFTHLVLAYGGGGLILWFHISSFFLFRYMLRIARDDESLEMTPPPFDGKTGNRRAVQLLQGVLCGSGLLFVSFHNIAHLVVYGRRTVAPILEISAACLAWYVALKLYLNARRFSTRKSGIFSNSRYRTLLARFSKDRGLEPNQIVHDDTPDRPEPFGYKCLWIAVKSDQTELIADVLKLSDRTPCNWMAGIQNGYLDDEGAPVFVSPPVRGWSFIVGRAALPSPETRHEELIELLNRLSDRFGEACFFGTIPYLFGADGIENGAGITVTA